MGAGKKSRSLPLKEKSDVPWGNFTRNLPVNELGAVIFGCKKHTITECLKEMMFGLPAPHYSYVKNVTPGLTLFLFNYSDRTLHGIFEATSAGQLNINRFAWTTSEGADITPYAAQVRVSVRRQCQPLFEEQFKPIIAKNYYSERLFWFELDKKQCTRLVQLFSSPPVPAKMRHPTPNTGWNNKFDALSEDASVPEKKCTELLVKENEHSYAKIVSTGDVAVLEKKWSELFKTSASSSTVKTEEESHKDKPNSSISDPVVECWEELAAADDDAKELHENELTCLQYHERDTDSSDLADFSYLEQMTVLDGDDDDEPSPSESESSVAREPGQVLIDTEEEAQPGNGNMTDRSFPETSNAMPGEVLTHRQTTDFESVIFELMRKIGGLKFYQLKQTLKVDSLEHELVNSKLEIEELKRRCHKLESVPSSDHCAVEGCQSPNITTEESVMIVGGFDGDSWLADLSSYSPHEDHFISLRPMTFTRSYASAAKLNGELYIFGGVFNDVWYDTVESYHPMSNQWVKQPSLNNAKGSLAGASLYEKIFAIGGGNGVECFSDVEILDLNIGSWIKSQPMLEKRFAPAAAEINGALYVAGGYDGKDYLRSVERFDPREYAWTNISSMNSKRGCHSLVAFKNKLYALGGYDGKKMVSSVEVYDPRYGSWMMSEPMTFSRGYFGSFVYGGKIHVIGGSDDSEVLDVTEFYDEGFGWQVTGRTSLGKRSFFSALVL